MGPCASSKEAQRHHQCNLLWLLRGTQLFEALPCEGAIAANAVQPAGRWPPPGPAAFASQAAANTAWHAAITFLAVLIPILAWPTSVTDFAVGAICHFEAGKSCICLVWGDISIGVNFGAMF